MAGISHIDELIDYKSSVVRLIGNSQDVVGLILDNPNINMQSDEAYSVFDRNIFDYDYVDDTNLEALAIILVDSDIVRVGDSMKDIELYVQVIVSKSYMELNPTVFRGVRGNRRDNLTRVIDLILTGRRDFGIGQLSLKRVTTARVPDGFSSKLLVYDVVNFGKNRKLLNNG